MSISRFSSASRSAGGFPPPPANCASADRPPRHHPPRQVGRPAHRRRDRSRRVLRARVLPGSGPRRATRSAVAARSAGGWRSGSARQALRADRMSRRIGFRRAARGAARRCSRTARAAAFDAFAAGVNAGDDGRAADEAARVRHPRRRAVGVGRGRRARPSSSSNRSCCRRTGTWNWRGCGSCWPTGRRRCAMPLRPPLSAVREQERVRDELAPVSRPSPSGLAASRLADSTASPPTSPRFKRTSRAAAGRTTG